MAYVDIYRIVVEDGPTHQRVTVAVAFVAQDVLAESDQTANHAARVTWARNTLADPRAMARKLVWAVASDTTVAATWPGTTDTQIKAAVAARVNDFSLA